MSEPSRIIIGDVIDGLRSLDSGSVHCCVTSPPYWGLRDYGVDGQIGLEKTPEEFVAKMVAVFREVRRCLRDDGTLWLNLGDSYATGTTASRMQSTNAGVGNNTPEAQNSVPRCGTPDGLKTKDLCMIPWRVALALQADGWWLRSVIVWAKKSPMPESVTDRPTSSWEPIFLMAKSERYFYDVEAVKEPSIHAGHIATSRNPNAGYDPNEVRGGPGFTGQVPPMRNQRNVWHLSPESYSEAHFATFPTEIPRRAIKAGTSERGCCAACGGPWVRVVERSPNRMGLKNGEHREVRRGGGLAQRTDDDCVSATGKTGEPRTLGWEASCTCGAAVVPCMVLDPFLGSGTTVAVARELGRHGVGIELNPEYAKLARERIGRAERPATFRSDRVIDSPLFGGVA